MYRIVFLLLSSSIFFSCKEKKRDIINLPYYNTVNFDPVFINDKSEVSNLISHTIDNFSFLNQDSSLITQSVFDNKIHVANFIFTTCGSICPVMTNNLKIVGNQFLLDTSVVLLSYSVTPWIDKPYVLKNYKQKNYSFNTFRRNMG